VEPHKKGIFGSPTEDDQDDSKHSHKHSTAGAALSDEEEDFSLKFPKEYHNKTLLN